MHGYSGSVRIAGVGALLVLLTVLFLTQIGTAQQSTAVQHATPTAPGGQQDPYWLRAKETVYKSVVEILVQHQAEVDRGIQYHKLIHGDPNHKYIALTFDDGPHPKYTPKTLALLKKNKVKATFFVVGEMAEKYPELVKAEVAAGHCIGNHTYHHVNLTKISGENVAIELEACNEVLQRITGKVPRLFRPPGGDYNHQVAEVSAALNSTMVLWTDDPGDYASPGAKVIETRLLNNVKNGGIILVHDGIQQTLDILPQVITYLKQQGYEFVTVEQMLAIQRMANRAKLPAPRALH